MNKNLIAVMIYNGSVRICLALCGTVMAVKNIKWFWIPFILILLVGFNYESKNQEVG